MNDRLKRLIQILRNKNIIGHKHIPEQLVIKQLLKNYNNSVRKQFFSEYKEFVKKEYVLRLKKRTGKGTEWHISLNPEKAKELNEIRGEEDETPADWSIQQNIW